MRRAALLVVVALLSGACGLGGGSGIRVTARFTDVGDLAATAPVMLADVEIGSVTDISLEGTLALVEMSIDPEARVPRGVIARIRRTSVLGERIVDIVIPADLPTDASLLENGDQIELTEVREDLEDLVLEGNDVLAPIAASEVATLVDEGAIGFGGRGEQLRKLLRNFEEIVDVFAGRSDTIVSVIGNLDAFNSALAARAEAHARAVANSARGLRMLREETGRLEVAVRQLAYLSEGSRSILEAHSDEMRRFFSQMRVILETLDGEQASIVRLLAWAPLHNRNLQITEFRDFVQVYQDFVICGMNDDPSDPARRCKENPG
ncbi:MAG TPA: MlaD family protein [Actinomycetota bacterium]